MARGSPGTALLIFMHIVSQPIHIDNIVDIRTIQGDKGNERSLQPRLITVHNS